jgi:hypothetical protein
MGVTAGVPSRFENELTLTSRRAFDRLPFHDALRGGFGSGGLDQPRDCLDQIVKELALSNR